MKLYLFQNGYSCTEYDGIIFPTQFNQFKKGCVRISVGTGILKYDKVVHKTEGV